eukprot:Nk52_evm5s389 gene=Nk52_evmTU5s389
MGGTKEELPDLKRLQKEHRLGYVAQYVRQNVATGEAIVEGKRVYYSPGKHILKTLLDSPYCTVKSKTSEPVTKKEEEIVATSRAEAEEICLELLHTGLFMHVAAYPDNLKKKPSMKSQKAVPLAFGNDKISAWPLDVPFVWIIEPNSWFNFTLGLLILVVTAACCLMPLWPPMVILGVRYISIFLLGIIGLFFLFCLLRLLVFCVAWCCTGGKLFFWVYPMLLEAEGFWDSFVPAYSVEWGTDAEVEAKGEEERDGDDDSGEGEEKREKGGRVVTDHNELRRRRVS